ncbi:MAG: carboxypeptidase-like regulatory domain-containing protein, partial [Gemmatimonadota bacterium]|nr:carboxypeptidase-like regulatory domain-containing protein [Gemmatimonadota bacterium]
MTDTAGEPIHGADVLLSVPGGGVQAVRSHADGRFEFGGLRAVPISVRVRRLGYRSPRVLTRLRPDTAPSLTFVLELLPIDIDGVVIRRSADDSKGRLNEFYEHKRRSRFGYFFERAEIDRRSPTHVSELLRTLRGVHLSPAGTLGNTV